MKKLNSIISVLLAVLMIFTVSPAAFAGNTEPESRESSVFYIDSENGNDENDGKSEDTPWKTVAAASANIYAPGDKVLFRRGQTFTGTFITQGSGSEDAPVTVSAYGEGADPVLTSEYGMVFIICNVSNWIAENLEVTAPNASGITIIAFGGANTENITVRNCCIHDLLPGETNTSADGINISNDPSSSRLNNIRVENCRIYNVPWGIHCSGITAEQQSEVYVSPEESFNSNIVLENLVITDCPCAGIVLSSVRDSAVRNCLVIHCATIQGEPYAPLWLRHSDNVMIEYCEIAGSENTWDGMAIDFDGWTTNSTYRYIYSHDNNRFMRSCVYDSATKNRGNRVYGCVSVNDNRRWNHSASVLISTSKPSLSRMHDFEFSDSIIVNASPILWFGTPSPVIRNISFVSSGFAGLIQRILNLFCPVKNFGFNNIGEEEINLRIAEITGRLPDYE